MFANNSRPLVLAHRGSSGQAPENTLMAFDLARTQGADGVELDVFLTADGEVVVTHDRDTTRLTGHNLDVCKTSYDTLKNLDFGKGERLPLLSQVFDLLKSTSMIVNVEIKSMGLVRNGVESAVAAVIRQFEFQNRVLISSFNPFHLWRIRRLLPKVATGYLVCEEQNYLWRMPWFIRYFQSTTINLDHKFANKPSGKLYRQLDLPIWLWTVNDEADMRFWLSDNICGIITNHPDRLIDTMKNHGQRLK